MQKLFISLGFLAGVAVLVAAFLLTSEDGEQVAIAARETNLPHAAASESPRGVTSDRSQVEATKPVADATAAEPESPWHGGLRGRVVTSAGTPVASATVKLRKTLQEEDANALGFEWSGEAIKHEQETQTDESGVFLLAHVPPLADCQLEISGAGQLVARRTATVPSGQLKDLGTIIVKTGALLGGVVRSSIGAPVAAAHVKFSDQVEVTSRDDGRFDTDPVPPGRYLTMVTAEGFADTQFPEVRVKEGQSITDLEFVLEQGLSISGRVVDPQGQPVKKAWVQAYSEGNSQWFGQKAVKDDGTFEVLGLKPGDYQLTAWADQQGWAQRVAVAGARDVELKIQGGVYVSGIVVDQATSKPVKAKRFEVQRNYDQDNYYTEGNSKADEVQTDDGRFRIMAPGGGEGKLRIQVTADGYLKSSSEPFTVKGSSIESLMIVMTRGSDITGTIVDAATQQPIAGCRVSLQKRMDEPHTREMQVFTVHEEFQSTGNTVRNRPNGDFEMRGVGAGTYRLQIACAGFAPFATALFEVKPGATLEPFTVAIARGSRLTGRVHDVTQKGIGAFPLRLTREDGNAQETATDDDGCYAFEDLAASRYALDVSSRRRSASNDIASLAAQVYLESDPKKPPQLITIRDGEPATFDLLVEVPRCGRLSGVVYENGSPAPRYSVSLTSMKDKGRNNTNNNSRNEVFFSGMGGIFGRRGSLSSQTDRAGTYEIENILPGAYQVMLSREGLSSAGPEATIELQPGEDLTFDLKVNTCPLVVRVIDAETGAPLQANVAVGQIDPARSRSELLQSTHNPWRIMKPIAFNTYTNGQGECQAQRMREGTYAVFASASDHVPEALPAVTITGSSANVTVALKPAGYIRVKITGREFDPTLIVFAEQAPSEGGDAPDRLTLMAGWQEERNCYEIRQVPAGHWRVVARAAGAKGGRGNDATSQALQSLGYGRGRNSTPVKVPPYEGPGANAEVDVAVRQSAEVSLTLP